MLQEELEFSCEGEGVYLVVRLEQVSTWDQEVLEGHKVSLCPVPGNTEAYSECPSPDQCHVPQLKYENIFMVLWHLI